MNNLKVNLKNEFILTKSGTVLAPDFNQSEFLSCFSTHDIFHGMLDDSILIGTIQGICRNEDLLTHLIPSDNAVRKNINVGAFHFRMWKLNEWFDVVVDDHLPVDTSQNLLFARNVTRSNEFWIALFEKAAAKY